MILQQAKDLSLFSKENAWLYFALLRRHVQNDNGLPFELQGWLNRHRERQSRCSNKNNSTKN